MKISVIIPVRNREKELRRVLAGLHRQTHQPYEIIVVDDKSSDHSLHIAREYGVTVHANQEILDANTSRNIGAKKATGDILLFLDSDVIPVDSLIERLKNIFTDQNIDAVVGLYSEQHEHNNISSQYKNLWIRFSYLQSGPNIDWIFGAVSAIRKEVFWNHNGFDDSMRMRSAGEDVELGKRVYGNHRRIVLDPTIEVLHLKKHNFASLLKNDFDRSKGFIRVADRFHQLTSSLRKGFVNVYPWFAYSSILAWAVVGLSFASLLHHTWFPWFAFFLLFYIAVNYKFLLYFIQRQPLRQKIGIFPLLFADHLVCGLGVFTGLFSIMTDLQHARRRQVASTVYPFPYYWRRMLRMLDTE